MARKHILLSLCLLIMSLSSMKAEEFTPYKGSRIFWDTSTLSTIFSSGWYSRIIQLQDGRLMAACENNGICIAFSSNGGTTWSSPVKIVTNTNNVPNCVPDLIQLSDGTIVVGYNPRPSSPYTEDRHFGIRCKRSTDNGNTWSNEIFIYDASYMWNDGCWEPSFLELPSGELQMYYSDEGPYTTNNDQNISVCRSFDKGVTWSKPEMVSYRAGSRDGMPCAVLLKDGKTIAVSIEDNGWPGVGDFFPTIVRCPLETNWHDYYVDGGSTNRNKTLDFTFCPNATGGAPYLRVLPGGETVMSYQSAYDHNGNLQMYVAVGNEEARNFKSLQHPFRVGDTETVMWNSLCIVDTGVVVAVGGVNSSIQMIKGYPVSTLQAPYSSPTINGVYTRNKGYLRPLCNQITLGIETGTRLIADFAYDEDSLYFFARAADRTAYPISGSYGDGIYLTLDMQNRSAKAPLTGEYRVYFNRDSTYTFYYGLDSKYAWTKNTITDIHYAISDNARAYVVEAAIPWKDLGYDKAPKGQILRANVEMQNCTAGTSSIISETIPDAQRNASWTWMELYLQPHEDTAIKNTEQQNSDDLKISSSERWLTISSSEPIKAVTLLAPDGSLISSHQVKGTTLRCQSSYSGINIVKCSLADGNIVTKKVIMK
jgi:hypothetical protein